MKTSSNNNNIESNNGMSQVINILTGETKKIRCHYLSKRTDKPVSRVLTLERLNHPALTAAGVTAWAERFNDGVNSFDWLRVSIQLTDKICYTPNCANVGLPDVENYGNLDYYMGQDGVMRVSMNNVDKFFQSIADKPAKMMTGEDWPNMAVIAAYRAAGRDKDAETLTAARDIYNARREADREAWSKKYAAQQYYYNSPKPKNFDELTELEKAQFMMQTAQECAKDHPELDWTDVLEKAEKRLEKAEKEAEALQRASEITDETFFTPGKKYRCIKSVKGDFTKGKVYDQSSDPTQWFGYFRNDKGVHHVWPQPAEIAHSCELYDMKPEDIDPRLYFEPVEDVKETEFSDTLTDDLKEGDRVLSRHYGAQATVLGREWDKQRKAWYYRVQFDTMQRHMDGSEFNVTEFHRDGLTKNYDPATGRERVGNAEYYRENLLAEFWGNDRTPRTVYGMEIFKPTDRRPSWLVVADIFSEPKEMTLREVCDMLAARYQEEQGDAA